MIRFLKERKILDEKDEVRLHFKAGQVVEDLPYDSEFAHVRRGFAAFVRDGKLFDHEGNEVTGPAPEPKKVRGLRRATGARPRVGRSRKPAGKKAAAKKTGK
jgi:hypothetical protein